MSELPTGAQYAIAFGTQRVVVTEVGATLREYRVGGRHLLDGFDEREMPDGSRGQPLLPWPNRLVDGRYQFDGEELQLPIDEVARHNAIHGLTRWVNWELVAQSDATVTLGTTLRPRPGYPFALRLDVEYTLADDGLTVRTVARNVGQGALPFGAGQHPYLTAGTPLVDDATLQFEAGCRLELDPERRIPTGNMLPVAGTSFDFEVPRTIGTLVLDDCFGNLARDAEERAWVTLHGEHTLSLWMDSSYRYVQVFTGETLASNKRRRGLAVEPMTSPPNAFGTGQDVIVLQPEDATTLSWGITPHHAVGV